MAGLIVPISKENLARYPADWRTVVRPGILARAGNRCEGSPRFPECRAPNGAFRVNSSGEWTMDQDAAFAMAYGEADVTRIVLTIAHLDHTPENCAPENLRAWCQRCHLAYDEVHHAQSAALTRHNRRARGDLFE